MHCPECDELRKCAAVTQDPNGQNYYTRLGEVFFFRRERQCLKFGTYFETAEVLTRELNEFVERLFSDGKPRSKDATGEVDQWRLEINKQKKAAERIVKKLDSLGATLEASLKDFDHKKSRKE